MAGSDGEFEHTQHIEAYRCADYLFEIDEYRRGEEQMLFAHIRLFNFTPSVFKDLKRRWKIFRECVTAPLFASAENADDKWQRFVTSLGFKPLDKAICDDGNSRPIFIHVKDSPDGKFKHRRQLV